MEYTTKIICINNTTNEIVIGGNVPVIARHIGTTEHTIKDWFRKGKTARKTVEGHDYTLYKADFYIKKGN